ncbi:MAG: hypothetical protein WBI79_01070 [Kiritimatiellia bacterium]
MLANSATKTKPTKQATTSMDKSFMRGIMLKRPDKVKREHTAPKTRPKNSPIAPTSSPFHLSQPKSEKMTKIGIFGRFLPFSAHSSANFVIFKRQRSGGDALCAPCPATYGLHQSVMVNSCQSAT